FPEIEWESVRAPWPGVKAGEFALSVGHAFSPEQKEKFLSTLQLTDFVDLNAPVESFDFSIFACRPRHYNLLRFQADTVMKTCSWKEKGLAEVGFFRSVPDSLESYYPKVISSTLTEKNFVYTMTHLRRFELGRLCLEGTLEASDWKAFYEGLAGYFERLSALRVGPAEVQERLRKLFIHKLSDRFEAFRQFPGFAELARKFQAETGVSFESRVRDLAARLEGIIAGSTADTVVFSHGDLSFCNILYDVETREIGLVDPRGKNAVDGCFQPVEYDLAKLSHSALGHYEAIVMDEGPFETESTVRNSFLDFMKKFPLSLNHLRSYEASLFWSLLPLHLDDPSHLLHFMKAGERAFQAGQS
ncbi:MAG TPA: hypothetical protein PL182_02850, partial [Pseudobdellovibrionaceae bacterium]|nr:hypothetical protein [Pseudobdellovibrionaceae bacterium]